MLLPVLRKIGSTMSAAIKSKTWYSVYITIRPRVGLFDETVSCTLSGLDPKSDYTIRAYLLEDGKKFESHAQYQSDEKGTIMLERDSSLGGSYKGMEPMGFIWSMKPSPGQSKYSRLVKKNVEEPIIVTVSAHRGHLNTSELQTDKALSSVQIERLYMAKNVERTPIRSGRVRGTFFRPKGESLYPGVIDMFGSAGGLMEHRSAILASRGFAVLSLAYFSYKDLPKTLSGCSDFSYFEEAVDWLIEERSTLGNRVGIIGTSLGGSIALCACTLFPQKISACVSIGGFHFNGLYDLFDPEAPSTFYHEKLLENFPMDLYKSPEDMFTKDEEIIAARFYPKSSSIPDKYIFECDKIRCPIMFIIAGDDMSLNAKEYAEDTLRRLPKNYEHRLHLYKGAGHLIEVPYAPHSFAIFSKITDKIMAMGGNPADHAKAQEDSWPKIQEFLRKNISQQRENCKL